MAEETLHLFKRYYFDMDDKKITEYVSYNTAQPNVFSSSLSELAEQIAGSRLKEHGRVYELPVGIVHLNVNQESIRKKVSNKRHEFLGERKYFNAPLSEQEEYHLEKQIGGLLKESYRKIRSIDDKISGPLNPNSIFYN